MTSSNGKVYVFCLKHTDKNDWEAPDPYAVHGLGKQGDDNINFMKFKEIARKNKKYSCARSCSLLLRMIAHLLIS